MCRISSGRLRAFAMTGCQAATPRKAARLDSRPIVGYSFRSNDTEVAKKAKARLEHILANARQPPPFERVEKLADGALWMPWTRDASYNAGYAWFVRQLGDLVPDRGQSELWRVVPHRGPEASRRDREAAGDAEASRPGGALPSSAASRSDMASGREEASGHGRTLKSPALLLLQENDAVLLKRGALYKVGSRIGGGTFGDVFAGRFCRGEASGHEFAIKRLKPSDMDRAAAQHEACILDRCQNHPHIVQLLDVFGRRDEGKGDVLIHLVLELWGEDLGHLMAAMPEGVGFEPSEVRCIVKHVASGVAHLHTALGLVHGDLKPANILVKRMPSSGFGPYVGASGLVCRVGDLGGALLGDPEVRTPVPDSVVRSVGLQVMNLNVRAPEVLFGDTEYSYPIDAWSLGVVTALVAGLCFTMRARSEVDYRFALFQQLGTPSEESELTRLPQWCNLAAIPPRFEAKPWPDSVASRLGSLGLLCLQSLLAWAPSRRLKVTEVAAHQWFEDTEPSRRAFGGEGLSSQPAPASTASGLAAASDKAKAKAKANTKAATRMGQAKTRGEASGRGREKASSELHSAVRK